MVVNGTNSGGGHCGWAGEVVLSSPCSVRQSHLPLEDAFFKQQIEWVTSRAQQQLLWDTLQCIKDKAACAFLPVDVGQPLDPFRETYNDGGLFGAGCNYAVGFHGIQGRQAKCEDYVLHLALGPDLFAPFDDCTRACLACVLDGHGGTGAVQYVAERFPMYLLADLPRLRTHPAAAMRAALHRIDEELTALGHNSGTTVNALVLVDNRITVVNTGDCRCILYDWLDERAVQVTHDHNLQSSRERERVLGEGAELSGCGSYVVLPCPTDGAKLLGVTKALGHAGVKALQRSFTMGSLSGILETELGEGAEEAQQGQQGQEPVLLSPRQQLEQQQRQQQQRDLPPRSPSGRRAQTQGREAAPAQVPLPPQAPAPGREVPDGGALGAAAVAASSLMGSSGLWTTERGRTCSGCGFEAAGAAAGAASGSGMSEDFPVMPSSASAVNSGVGLPPDVQDADMCSSCFALGDPARAGSVHKDLLDGLVAPLPPAAASAATSSPIAMTAACGRVPVTEGRRPDFCRASAPPAPFRPAQDCDTNAASNGAAPAPPHSRPLQQQSSFATPAAAALAAVVASGPQLPEPLCPAAAAASAVSLPSLTALATSSTGGFVLTCEPDEFEFTVEDDRHLVLLGCDGVFDRMGNAEVCRTAVRQLTSSNSCVDAAREVAHRACRLGSLDNITALVLRFGRKPIVRRQSFSVLRRSSSNTSGDLAASGGSVTSRS